MLYDFCIHMLQLILGIFSMLLLITVNLHTKFEMSSIIRPNDMFGAPKFKKSHVMLTTPQ